MAVSSLARPKVGLITATGGDDVFDIPVVSRGLVMRVHKFETSSNFVVSAGAGQVEVLLCAGGGGSGGLFSQTNMYRLSGMGGSGGVIHTAVAVTPASYAVAVGNGGSGGGASSAGGDGGDSTAFGLTAVGGGGGAAGISTGARGRDGGSGGTGWFGGSGVAGQGVGGVAHAPNAAVSEWNGAGLDYQSDITGQLVTYAPTTVPPRTNEYQNDTNPGSTLGEYGQGGVARGRYVSGTLVGNEGTDGVVIIRYALRSL